MVGGEEESKRKGSLLKVGIIEGKEGNKMWEGGLMKRRGGLFILLVALLLLFLPSLFLSFFLFFLGPIRYEVFLLTAYNLHVE